MTKREQAKACVIHGAQDLRIEPRAIPELEGDDVLVRLAAGGICGSDQHYYLEGKCGAFAIREPFVPGHEVSGHVEAVGPEVGGPESGGLPIGGLVAINPSRPCGTCPMCRSGKVNLCRNNGFLGSASRFPHAQGMFSEYFMVKAAQCVPVDAAVDAGCLAMAEPLSVALHAVNRAGRLEGMDVLVVGARTIGLLIALAARLRGAASVTVTDLSGYPLEVARRCGIDQCVRVGPHADRPDFTAEMRDRFDVAFEVSGSEPGLADTIEMTAPRGTLVQVGTLPPLTGRAAVNQIMVKEINYFGSFRFDEEFGEAVELLASGRLDVRPLLTRQFALEEARQAFLLACDANASIKVQIIGSQS